MIEKHTLRSFEEALASLSEQILTMGQEVARMAEAAGIVFQERNVEGAKALVERDLEIDRQHDNINAAVVDILARFHPVARDLREVLATEHIAANLERVADHAKGIAKRMIANSATAASAGTARILRELQVDVVRTLTESLRALEEKDPARADKVRRDDVHLDQLYDDLFHTVIAGLRASPDAALGEVQALFVGKSLERIGDHATNIAEEVRFMTKGICQRQHVRCEMPPRKALLDADRGIPEGYISDISQRRLLFDDLIVELDAYRVSRSGRVIDLGPMEYRMLCFLLRHPSKAFTREELVVGVWPPGAVIELRTVDVHIARLRRSLTRYGHADPIRTVRTVGYALG